MPVKMGHKVSMHFEGRLRNGLVFDRSRPGQPLVFTVGDGLVPPGLERAVLGRDSGQAFEVHIPYDEAYGAHDPDLIFSVPLAEVPPNIDVQAGQQLHVATDQGELEVVLLGLRDGQVWLDANHPLAGEDLLYKIEIIEIN